MISKSSLNQNPKLQSSIKLITGLDNLHCLTVIKKVQAGVIGGISYVDVAANLEILNEIWQMVDISICVSSISMCNLVKCIKSNVDYVEIGNYDIFYRKGIFLKSEEILHMTKQLLDYKYNTKICVTIPHYLSLLEQHKLIADLDLLDVDLIQTEGLSTKLSSPISFMDLLLQASASLSATYMFKYNCNIPIISSSGFNILSSAIAMIYGAEFVGLGSSIGFHKNTYNYALQIAGYTDTIFYNTVTKIDSLNFSFHYRLSIGSHYT